LLSIKLADIGGKGITINRSKGGKSSLYKWTNALLAVMAAIRGSQKKIGGMYLFST